MTGEELRTTYSRAAHDLALEFVRALGDRRIGKAEYVPKITEIETDSTGGGVTVKQSIRLVSQASGMPPLLVGHANVKESTAEIRAFDFLEAVHRERFDAPPPLPRDGYEAFLDELEAFLEKHALRTQRLATMSRSNTLRPPAAASSAGMVKGFVLGLVVAAVVVAMWFFLRK